MLARLSPIIAAAREDFETIVATLRDTVASAQRDASMTGQAVDKIGQAAEKLRHAQDAADAYLTKLNEVLAEAHEHFSTHMLNTVKNANKTFHQEAHEVNAAHLSYRYGIRGCAERREWKGPVMLFARTTAHRNGKEEGERPFWISFADLMTALMVLFLVSLSVALNDANKRRDEAVKAQVELKKEREELARAKAELEEEKRKRNDATKQRATDLQSILSMIDKAIARHDGVRLDRERHVIDFGSRAQFRLGRNDLTPDQTNALRKFIPELLNVARTDLGRAG